MTNLDDSPRGRLIQRVAKTPIYWFLAICLLRSNADIFGGDGGELGAHRIIAFHITGRNVKFALAAKIFEIASAGG